MGVPLRSAAAGPDPGTWSRYVETPPAPALVDVVRCRWQGNTGWARALRVLPDGCADIVWDGRELTVVAARAVPFRHPLPGGGERTGIRLRCGAAGALLGRPMADLAGHTVALATLWGGPARRAEESLAACTGPAQRRRVLEELVAVRLRVGAGPDPRALAAVHALGAHRSAPAAAAALGTSERTLRRTVDRAVGLAPKQLQRVLRFQQLVSRLPRLAAGCATLADAAADLGYADQSHLGRECLRLSGSTPTALVRGWQRAEGGRNVPDNRAGAHP